MRLRLSHLALFLLSPAVSIASAQLSSTNQGPASSLAAGLSLPPAGTAEVTLAKAPLDQTSPPPAWSRALFPTGTDYSLTAMFGALAPYIQIAGHSTGNDNIPELSGEGVPNVAGRTWMGVIVSVNNAAVGTPGSLIDRRRHLTSGRLTPGSDLLAYYYDESVNLAPALVDATVVEQSSEALGFSGNEDVDALDFGLGVTSYARGTSSTLFFTNTSDYFFTLDPACITLLNENAVGGFTDSGLEANAATVYRLEQLPGGTWEPKPSEYRSPDDLGLDPDEDRIDALAVDPGTNVTIFSTQLHPERSQLRVHGYIQGVGYVWDLKNNQDQKVTFRIGSNDGTDDVDAVCVIDPENQVGSHLACPRDLAYGAPFSTQPMGMSITRSRSPAGVDLLHFQLTGFGPHPPADSLVTLQLSVPNYAPAWADLGTFLRPASSSTWELTAPIPPNFQYNHVAFVAVQASVNLEWTQSWTSEIRLQP